MTLLVRKRPRRNAAYPYAVQMAVPRELTEGGRTAQTSVRLLDQRGVRATALKTMDTYHPEKWRAARPLEQGRYAAAFNGNPRPWFCLLYSLTRSVFEFGRSGDKDTNNGQRWPEIENLDVEWEIERETRRTCEEVLDAEWNRRVARWGEND